MEYSHTHTILAVTCNMEKKQCSKCNKEKLTDEFYRGVRQCKECVKEACKKYKK